MEISQSADTLQRQSLRNVSGCTLMSGVGLAQRMASSRIHRFNGGRTAAQERVHPELSTGVPVRDRYDRFRCVLGESVVSSHHAFFVFFFFLPPTAVGNSKKAAKKSAAEKMLARLQSLSGDSEIIWVRQILPHVARRPAGGPKPVFLCSV